MRQPASARECDGRSSRLDQAARDDIRGLAPPSLPLFGEASPTATIAFDLGPGNGALKPRRVMPAQGSFGGLVSALLVNLLVCLARLQPLREVESRG